MTTVRLVLGLFLVALAAYVVVMNWICVVVSLRNRRRGINRHHSMVPLVSLISAALAYLTWPERGQWWIAAVPAADIATWSLFLLPVALLRK